MVDTKAAIDNLGETGEAKTRNPKEVSMTNVKNPQASYPQSDAGDNGGVKTYPTTMDKSGSKKSPSSDMQDKGSDCGCS